MRQTMLEKAAGAFNLPTDLVAGLPRIEITGCRELLIENHRGLIRFDPREVIVSGGAVKLVLRGDDLTIRAMNARELRLEGQVFGLDIQY